MRVQDSHEQNVFQLTQAIKKISYAGRNGQTRSPQLLEDLRQLLALTGGPCGSAPEPAPMVISESNTRRARRARSCLFHVHGRRVASRGGDVTRQGKRRRRPWRRPWRRRLFGQRRIHGQSDTRTGKLPQSVSLSRNSTSQQVTMRTRRLASPGPPPSTGRHQVACVPNL